MACNAGSVVRNTVDELQQLAGRVEAELAFARWLCDQQKSKGAAFGKLIAQAEALVPTIFASGSVQAVTQGVAQIEALLAPIGKFAKQYTIYCVGHAHIDMNWMWGWPETVAVTNDTFTTVLKLMDEFPTFHFSQSQASTYAMIEKHNPQLLQRIAQRVKEGRWEVTASHWVEGDRNMVSGESLTRHLLYTRRYMKQIFGLSAEDVQIDWAPDTFGHAATVPMYLRRGGVKWVYLHRPGSLGVKCPPVFWWKSPDNSRVLVRNDMANGYNGAFNGDVWKVLQRDCAATGLSFSMFVYGVGDHGGGPTRRDIARAIEMNAWPIFPNLTFAPARDFYARMEKEGAKLPTLDCELNTELTGCYTTQSLIKRCNRVAENRLTDAEAFCTIATASIGRAYPAADFVEGWRDTLFGHFHDILPGSNVHDSRTYTHGLFQKTMATTSMAETLALRELAAQITTAAPGVSDQIPPAGSGRSVLGAGVGYASDRNTVDAAEQTAGGTARPFVLFNPTAWERQQVVEATLWGDSPLWQATDEMRGRQYAVRTPDGQIIQAQKVDQGTFWGHSYVKVAFPAKTPAMGYATYTVLEETSKPAEQIARQITPPHHCFYVIAERRREGLENDLLQLELDPMTGGIRRLLDKRSRLAIIDCQGDAPILEYLVEKPHGMAAWVIDNACQRQTPQVIAIDRKLDGPYKATVDVKLKIAESDLTLTYELRAGDPCVHLHLTGTWLQRGTPQTGIPSLRLGLPLSLGGAKATYEIPFGALQRDLNHNEELPALNWAMVQGKAGGKSAGLLLANDCKHGYSLDGSTLHLTLIRSAYDPDPLPEIGQHEIHLDLLPFAGLLDVPAAIRAGRELNRPLRVVGTSVHAGKLSAVASAIDLDNDSLILACLKQTEDGQDVVLRLLNPTDKPQTGALKLNGKLMGKFVSATEVDLMEQPIKPSAAKLAGEKLTVSVPANGLASVKLVRA